MKRIGIFLLGITMLAGCSKKKVFDISQYWWGNSTLYGNKEISIRFISDTKFEFMSEEYLNGSGTYYRTGNDVTFNFETHTIGFGQSYIKFLSGTWTNYPKEDYDVYKADLKLTYERWFDMGFDITTEKEEKQETLSIISRRQQ